MFVSWRYEGSPKNWENWERYFDTQVKQKVLPKLHGSQKAIGQTINELFNACLIERKNNADARLVDLTKKIAGIILLQLNFKIWLKYYLIKDMYLS